MLQARGHLFIPVTSILFVMYSGYSAPLAALTGTLLCFPVAWFGPAIAYVLPVLTVLPVVLPAVPTIIPSVFGLSPVVEAALFAGMVTLWWWSVRHKTILLKIEGGPIVRAMIDGARNTLPVAMACAAAGIIIGVTILTGFGITFTQWVVAISQEILLVALILTAVAGIVLGMGLPTTPSYILMAALLIPALVQMGVVTPAAHMFAFYFAILSAITPPIALAVFAAAGLAKANIWDAGWAAMRVGAAGFIVPFMFVYDPSLLMIGEWPNIVWRFVLSCVGHRPAGRRPARLPHQIDAAVGARRGDHRRDPPRGSDVLVGPRRPRGDGGADRLPARQGPRSRARTCLGRCRGRKSAAGTADVIGLETGSSFALMGPLMWRLSTITEEAWL